MNESIYDYFSPFGIFSVSSNLFFLFFGNVFFFNAYACTPKVSH